MANEKRLIDANALKEKGFADHDTGEGIVLVEDIDKAHTVDAVEVVRCKDCKHWHEETGWCNQHSHFWDSKGEFCHPWESIDWKTFDENNFCSDGERKDNG